MHFLLDTNTFIDYVKESKDEEFIEQIIILVDEGVIQLLVPDILLSEWKEKKQKTLEYVSKTFESTVTISTNEMTGVLLKENFKNSRLKATAIDKLLANGIFIKTTQSVKAATMDRSIAHKAPFHGGKTKTTNDALIYFSSLYFLKKNKILEFVFITKDSGDFGSPENKNDVLHPELQDPDLIVLYFTSLFKCFDKLKEELKIKKPDKEGQYQLIISKKRDKNFLDHLHDVIQVYRSKISFLPAHILSKIDPFRVSDIRHDYAYHAGNTLYTNNKHLLEFFKQVDIKKMRFRKGSEFRNTKKNLLKLDFIIICLNQNMVFNISYVTHGDKLSIYKEPDSNCRCSYCTYRRLSFDVTIKNVYDDKDELKRAFVLFQLGKFNESLIVYNNIYENAIKEDHKTMAYRILLILHWVAHYTEYQNDDDLQEKALIYKIKSIDREKAFLSALHESKLDKEIALFLHGDTLINHYRLAIDEYSKKIKEHYRSQLGASYSSNSNLQNLINEFLSFEMFTVYNGMAYIRYSDFGDICDGFIEAIFISITLNEYQSSRIEYLDDYLLEKMLFYGKADKMIRHFNHYVKRQIPYQSKQKAFEKIALNFLSSDKEIIEQFASVKYYEGNSSFFKIFWNLILLLAIIDFEETFVINCTKKINNFLERLPKRETHQLNHLASLINSKGKVLQKRILQPLFKFILTAPNLHNESLFDAMSPEEGYKFKLDLSVLEFENLLSMSLNKCDKCGEYHKNIVYHMFPLLSKKFQALTSVKINQQLKTKFDRDLYFISVMGDIIDYRPFFNQYLNLFVPVNKSESPFSHLQGEILYQHLSNLMNLVFKTKARLPKNHKEQFKGLTNYYNWLLDMNGFNYDKFKPIWLIQYAIKYYLEEAFSVEKVKASVRKFLKANNQPTLAFYYSQYVK